MTARRADEEARHVRQFSDEQVLGSELGRRWITLLGPHRQELLHHYARDAALQERTDQALRAFAALIRSRSNDDPVVDPTVVAAADALLDGIADAATPGLRMAVEEVRRDVHGAQNLAVQDALRHP